MSGFIYVCWSETGQGRVCAGRVKWEKRDTGVWHSACRKCGATGIAAVGERVVLEQMEVRSGE